MSNLNILIPSVSAVVSLIFAFYVLKLYFQRKGLHLLFWGSGMLFYAIGGLCEAYYGAFGWNALIYRLWYLCGAILVGAWLGQGTVYLLMSRKWAHILMVLLVLASLYGAVRVITADLDPSLLTKSVHTGSELSG